MRKLSLNFIRPNRSGQYDEGNRLNKITVTNVLGAAILQAGNFLVPLALLPWFARKLGVAGYGEIAYITAVIAYFVLLVDWGFSLSATKSIAIHRSNKLERSRAFCDTVVARILLALMGAVALELICLFLREGYASNYRLAYLTVWATAINPAFYYQGVEKISRMAIIQTTIRVCVIPLVYLTVSSDADLAWAVGIPASVFLLAALVNLIVLVRSTEIQWVSPTLNSLAGAYMAGWPLFLSTAGISLYTNANTVILGLVSGNAAVGLFSSAMVFIKAAHGFYQPVSQVLFPRMSHKFFHDPDGANSMFLRMLKLQSAATLIGSIMLVILAPWLVGFVLGERFDPVVSVLFWLAPIVFLIGVSNALGVQGMIPLGYNRTFTRIVMLSGVLNIALIIPLGSFFGAEGGAMAALISECCVTLFMARFLLRNEPKLFGPNL